MTTSIITKTMENDPLEISSDEWLELYELKEVGDLLGMADFNMFDLDDGVIEQRKSVRR